MKDAVTYENLHLKLGETVLSVYQLSIVEEPGKHGRMYADAQTQEGEKEYLLYEECGDVALYADRGERMESIFQGIVIKMDAAAKGGRCEIHLEAVTNSYMMDLSVLDFTFQDTAMSSCQLFQSVMQFYPDSQALFFVPDVPIGQIAVQYQETDWAFLNRMLSHYGAGIYPDSTMPGICMRMGLTDDSEETDWDALFYTVMRDAAPERAEKERKGQMCYTVEADDILPLGVKTVFHGQELYIGKIYRHLRKGILVSEYTLYFLEGMEIPRYNNPLLCGVSQYGTVTEVKRNQIRAALENDALIFCDDQYFYPYSTVAASPDGSGWYCMPKPGDPVRIFFPSEDEREGYAVSNIEGESAPGQDSPISNPDLKDIIMPDGKGVKFIEGGIEVCVGDFLGDITLTDDGKVQMKVKEEKDIRIYSEGMVYFMAEEGGTIEASAGTQIQIKNDAGGEICMTDDTVRIEASSIENN